MSTHLPKPLEGIRIVECAVWHAGPGASAILADMGAEVIKVETLAGDPERSQVNLGAVSFDDIGGSDFSFLFELSNRNKRSICLDITSDEGAAVFRKLIESADVFLTNLRNSTKPRLGIDYDSIRAINPDIVHANVSGYGPNGPMRDVGAFDPMGQGISGMVFLTGSDEPILLQSVVLDQMTSIAASHAVMSALFVRERHGFGQEVHVSLYSAALWLTHSNLLATGILGRSPVPRWDRYNNSPLRNCFRCSDGGWIMGTNHPEQKFWPLFCRTTGQEQLIDDSRYADVAERTSRSKELVEYFEVVFAERTRDEWLTTLQDAGLMFAPVQELTEVLKDEQALANDYVVDFDHPELGAISIPGFPIQFSANSAGTVSAAPALGGHTVQVLKEYGYSDQDIDRLRHRGAIN
ncbi:MAG: CoA transferase [Gammaproteobacteria bacterium]|nr:CoA transferase [Gammaproteobacteria bacterium]RPG23673.1 MAG: CoA transferase [Gammaproteobacteria bacterium TMED50]|tara:strand:+ start:6487 stop:7710 length:1224 start_codon:yes stop_codon:yes gene_type:complete